MTATLRCWFAQRYKQHTRIQKKLQINMQLKLHKSHSRARETECRTELLKQKIPRTTKQVRHKFSRILEAKYLMPTNFWIFQTNDNIASKSTTSTSKYKNCKLIT